MNWAQLTLSDDPHECQIVLKGRQIGITTYFCLKFLDQVLWTHNTQAGIIAHTLVDAQNIFIDKIKFAFDNLPAEIHPLFKTVGDSARELLFSNGSSIRVGTSLRSSTLQFLHISEFGKICAKYPEKAREIITGALNTIHPGQFIGMESTAEGREGKYYEMVQTAFEKQKRNEFFGVMDFYPFFFPWYKHPSYVLDEPQTISPRMQKYFKELEAFGIKLTDSQKKWYSKKEETQKEDMFREYPSIPDEAFMASQDGKWYSEQLKQLYKANHITNISYDRTIPVHTSWDLGQRDAQAIWFFQIDDAQEVRVIDYFESSDFSIDRTMEMLNQKGYSYGTHLWPCDAEARDKAGITFVDQAKKFNLHGVVLERHGLLDGINLVRMTLPKMWFDKEKCNKGIIALESYKKEWSNSLGGYTSKPRHDGASNGADAMRYLVAGLQEIKDQRAGMTEEEAMEMQRKYKSHY